MTKHERISRLEAFSRSIHSQARARTRNELDGIISKIEPAALATMPEPLRGMIQGIRKQQEVSAMQNNDDPTISWSEVPAVALDAFRDGELTLDELRECYPFEVTP